MIEVTIITTEARAIIDAISSGRVKVTDLSLLEISLDGTLRLKTKYQAMLECELEKLET